MVPFKYLILSESELLRLLFANSAIIFFVGSLVFCQLIEYRKPKIDVRNMFSNSYIVFGLHILVKAIYGIHFRTTSIKAIEITGGAAIITAAVFMLLALLAIFYGIWLRIPKTDQKEGSKKTVRKSLIVSIHTIASAVIAIDSVFAAKRI